MRKFMVTAIPITALSIFILVMLSGDLLKRPLAGNDNIPLKIEVIIEGVNSEKWEEVSKETKELDLMWRNIVKRVQFSSERDEINYFSMNIARLNGAIMAKNKADALIELKEAYEHWEGLGK